MRIDFGNFIGVSYPYWSELSMIETPEVEKAMIVPGTALSAYKAAPNDKEANIVLDNSIYGLAHAIRKGIESSWASL
jgi:hypothetical protein